MYFNNREISASAAADELGVTATHVAHLLRTGQLGGRQLRSGEWLTSPRALEVYRAISRRGRGRTLNAASAWGVLWELSGLRATWLDASTRSRLRSRIAEWDSGDIVRAVSHRTRETRYAIVGEDASYNLIRTGRSVAGDLGEDLRNRPRLIVGYPRFLSPTDHADFKNMKPDYEGEHALYENTLPIPYDLPQMPVAVIAADLARSPFRPDREAAIRALDSIWDNWAATS